MLAFLRAREIFPPSNSDSFSLLSLNHEARATSVRLLVSDGKTKHESCPPDLGCICSKTITLLSVSQIQAVSTATLSCETLRIHVPAATTHLEPLFQRNVRRLGIGCIKTDSKTKASFDRSQVSLFEKSGLEVPISSRCS